MDRAIASPSWVEVPRPSSSIMTRLSLVTCLFTKSAIGEWIKAWEAAAGYLRIMFISVISTAKVPKLLSGLSSVDRRVKRRSQMGIAAYVAGTKLPTCAMIWIKAMVLMNVLLPLMLPPVTTWKRAPWSPE
jgi:hypothetical protein